jgi:hypothetical protein
MTTSPIPHGTLHSLALTRKPFPRPSLIILDRKRKAARRRVRRVEIDNDHV